MALSRIYSDRNRRKRREQRFFKRFVDRSQCQAIHHSVSPQRNQKTQFGPVLMPLFSRFPPVQSHEYGLEHHHEDDDQYHN